MIGRLVTSALVGLALGGCVSSLRARIEANARSTDPAMLLERARAVDDHLSMAWVFTGPEADVVVGHALVSALHVITVAVRAGVVSLGPGELETHRERALRARSLADGALEALAPGEQAAYEAACVGTGAAPSRLAGRPRSEAVLLAEALTVATAADTMLAVLHRLGLTRDEAVEDAWGRLGRWEVCALEDVVRRHATLFGGLPRMLLAAHEADLASLYGSRDAYRRAIDHFEAASRLPSSRSIARAMGAEARWRLEGDPEAARELFEICRGTLVPVDARAILAHWTACHAIARTSPRRWR